MTQPRAFRHLCVAALFAGLFLPVPLAAGQQPLLPSRPQQSSDTSSRLEEAARDSTLEPWKREIMLDLARRGPTSDATWSRPGPLSDLPSPGAASPDGQWSELVSLRRQGHTAIYDPVRDRMLVFGGSIGSSLRNDVYALSLSGIPSWSLLVPAGTHPPEHYAHTAIYDPVRDRMLVFGGSDGFSDFNSVWALSLAESPAWSELTPTGTPPPGRLGHTAIYDAVRDRMLVFGGSDGSGSRKNDVWSLSLAGSPAWSALATVGTPPPVWLHTATIDPVRDRMVVFGGLNGLRANDVWALSLSGDLAWSQLSPAGTAPVARYLHTAIYDPVRDRMVVFGGYDYVSAYPFYLNDVWALTLTGAPAWSAVAPAGTPPHERDLHTAVYDPVRDRMVVFGGSSDGGVLNNDVWSLSLVSSAAWSGLMVPGTPPAPRQGHSAVYDPVRDRMIVFGGRAPNANDVWALPLAGSPNWSQLAATGSRPSKRFYHAAIYDPVRDRMLVFGGSDGLSDFNDVWALSLSGDPAWTAITPTGSPPSVRYGASAIYDPVRDRMVVFGGGFESPLHDVWALSFAGEPAWNEITPHGGPPVARVNHTAIYDPVRDRMVVFGGNDYSGNPDYLNDVWALSFAGGPTWSDLAPEGTVPRARFLHAAIYDPVGDRMVVFAGSAYSPGSDDYFLDDTWALALSGSPAWSALTPAGTPPAGRFAPTAIYDPVRRRMVVFGGYSYQGGHHDDVWALAFGNETVPVLVSLVQATAEADRVSLAWYGSESAGETGWVERREESTEWLRLAMISADGTGTFLHEDGSVRPGGRYAYRLAYRDGEGAETVTAETWVEVPAAGSLVLEGLQPNPARAGLFAVFSLPDDAPAVLALVDISGRIALERQVGSLGAGRHVLPLIGAGELPAGVYWLRLERMGIVRFAKAIILR